jgi:hypothetical protein
MSANCKNFVTRAARRGAISVENQKPPGTRELGPPVGSLAIDDKGSPWIEQGNAQSLTINDKQARSNQRSPAIFSTAFHSKNRNSCDEQPLPRILESASWLHAGPLSQQVLEY